MRGFAAVFRRELFERRLLVLLAVALGLTAVLLPLVPGVRPGDVTVPDLQWGIAVTLGTILTVLLALFLGGSIVATDLAERRLGFYFSRPISGWAVWAGKMAAACALILGCGILVFSPAALLAISSLDAGWSAGNLSRVSGDDLLVVAWALSPLFLLLAAHALSVIVRARSTWAFLDLAALALVTGLVWGAMQRLKLEGVLLRAGVLTGADRLGIAVWMEVGLAAAGLLALAVASALQVVHGRTDLRRAHQVLSQGLWGMLLAAALLFAGLTAWVLAAGPGDLLGVVEATAGPGLAGGHWIALSGPAARRSGYNPSFLHDLDSGRTFRIRFGLVSYSNVFGTFDPMVRFSADGRRVIWLEYDGEPFASPVAVHRLDLDPPGATPARTPVSYRTVPRGFALSPDGRRVAAYEEKGSLLTVSEVENGRLLAAARYDSTTDTPRLAFAGPGLLRILELGFPDFTPRKALSTKREILELDLTAGSPRPWKTGEIPAMAGGIREWSLAPEGDRLLLRSADTLGLFDARTGMPLAILGDGGARGTFLRDRRIAVVEPFGGHAGDHELRIFSPDGRSEPRRLPFAEALSVIVADQPEPGALRVVTSRRGAPPNSHELWRVDLERGTVQPLGTRRLAILDLPQIPRSRVDLAGVDGVVWWEPWTSRARVVLKGR